MLKHFISIVFLLILLSSSLFAQSNDGSLRITVKDQLGGAVAGAEVTVSSESGPKFKQKVLTDVSGSVRIQKMPKGQYVVTVVAIGFGEYKHQPFEHDGRESKLIEIGLDVASIETNVEIDDNDSTDPSNTGVAVVLNEDMISKLPDNQEELERAIRRIGEAVTGEDLPISVNGVQDGKIPPKGSIQQIRVNQNVFSAQYEGPFGGGIDIFTRSGVDKFRTYLGFSFADAKLNAADPYIGQRLPFQMRNYFVSLSGPIIKKKASFFLYGYHTDSDSSSAVNATILDTSLRPVPFREAFATPSRNDGLNIGVNADPTPKHKLYLNYNFNLNSSKNQNVGGFSLPSRANDSDNTFHYLQFSDTFLINPNVVNQTRFLTYYSGFKNTGGSEEAAINALEAFYGGGSQSNSSSSNLRIDVSNDTTWQIKNYSLGFGVRLRREHITQTSRNNFGGTFTFSGRTAPVLNANNEPVFDEDGNPILTQISSLESYRRTLLFQGLGYGGQQIRELGGGANQFTISGGDPRLEATQYDYSVYLQNSYKVSETISISGGLRYEDQTNISSRKNFAPRFGIVWAPKAKEKQSALSALPRISIGYGVFFSRFPLNNTVNVRQANDPDRSQYLVTETNVLNTFPNVPTIETLEQFALPRTQRLINDGLQTPYQSLVNLTINKRLPKKFSTVFTIAHGKTFRQSITRNINAPLAGTFDPLDPSSSVRPFGSFGNIYETMSLASFTSTRYSLSLAFPQSQKLFANLRYSYLSAKDNNVGSSGSAFDPYDFSREYSRSSFDGLHSIGGYFSLTLPKGFNLGGDMSINSGRRFNITTGRDSNGDGSYTERPSFASDLNKPGLVETEYGILDPNPGPNDQIIPRNLGRSSANFVFNSFVSKTFSFNQAKDKKTPPKQSLNFSLRANNVFNIISRGVPVGNMSSPNFLRSLSNFSDGGITIINGAQQPNFAGRSLNLSVGFSF